MPKKLSVVVLAALALAVLCAWSPWLTQASAEVRAVNVFKGVIKSMADFNHADWIALLQGEVEKISLPQHKERKTREWILTQVVPAMARYIVDTGDDKLIDDFREEFEGALKKALERLE